MSLPDCWCWSACLPYQSLSYLIIDHHRSISHSTRSLWKRTWRFASNIWSAWPRSTVALTLGGSTFFIRLLVFSAFFRTITADRPRRWSLESPVEKRMGSTTRTPILRTSTPSPRKLGKKRTGRCVKQDLL